MLDSPYQTEQRVGQGFDIHRLVPDKPLIIGGVSVESPVGSLAHSDGDALFHSLIDAVLGATGQGDIGDHFPPSDAQYKNANSVDLFQAIWTPLMKAGWKVINIDATVFLEAPKLGPYKQAIRKSIAKLVNIDTSCVTIKAKTAEKFPPVGTQEAIATSVTVLLSHTY